MSAILVDRDYREARIAHKWKISPVQVLVTFHRGMHALKIINIYLVQLERTHLYPRCILEHAKEKTRFKIISRRQVFSLGNVYLPNCLERGEKYI